MIHDETEDTAETGIWAIAGKHFLHECDVLSSIPSANQERRAEIGRTLELTGHLT